MKQSNWKSTRTALVSGAVLAAMSSVLGAQDRPISAIDWLSETIAQPITVPHNQAPVASSAATQPVSVSALDAPTTDGVGLLPSAITGLPDNLWGNSDPARIVEAIIASPTMTLPALITLRHHLLLAETTPPPGANGEILIARIDKLLEIGALEDANALLERAGPETSAVLFRQWFDTSLLIGVEDRACNLLRRNGAISPSYAARVFCLARNGDWSAAAMTLNVALSLELIDSDDYDLISRFLDPDLYEGTPPPRPPEQPTPLEFRMFEAIGDPVPTRNLPRAFAFADLRTVSGWKPRIEAAERLARSGAIHPNQLLGIYSERLPAASGGVWERVKLIQRLESAISADSVSAVARLLPELSQQFHGTGLEPAIATLFAEKLAKLLFATDHASEVFRLSLLSPDYETYANTYEPKTPQDRFLIALARGDARQMHPETNLQRAIKDGFDNAAPDATAAQMLKDNRLGEVIFLAITKLHDGARGDLTQASEGLRLLRQVGLEGPARQAALQMLVLRQ